MFGGLILNKLGKEKIETVEGDIKWNRPKNSLVIKGQYPVPPKYIKAMVTIELTELLEIVFDMEDITELESILRNKGVIKETVMKNEVKKDIKNGGKIEFAYIDDSRDPVIK